MDAHEKNAVMISAHAGLPAGPRDLLHDMLFLHARPRAASFTRDAAALVRKGRSLRSVWRYLNALEDGDWIGIEPGPVRYHGGCPQRSPNTYRIHTVAERHACQIGTILIPAESKIPTAGTGDSTAREAARAKWLPELPGGDEVSLPTNTPPDQRVEILAAPEPVCGEVATIDPRLGGFSVSLFAPSFEAAKRDTGVPSDKMGLRTEAARSGPPAAAFGQIGEAGVRLSELRQRELAAFLGQQGGVLGRRQLAPPAAGQGVRLAAVQADRQIARHGRGVDSEARGGIHEVAAPVAQPGFEAGCDHAGSTTSGRLGHPQPQLGLERFELLVDQVHPAQVGLGFLQAGVEDR
jgi:hypothetical protein